MLAHELRAPLQSILGLQSLLGKTSPTPEQERYIAMTASAGAQLLELIHGLLEENSAVMGASDDRLQVLSLRTLVDGCLDTLSPLAHAKSLELSGIVPSDLDDHWMGDAFHLRQILVNLIGNAIQFTEHGEVTLRILPGTRSQGSRVIGFQVSDTGSGMSPETVFRLFHTTLPAEISGPPRLHGYGLSICRKWVKSMGGEWEYQSELGRGTTVIAWIPLYMAPQVREPHFQILPDKAVLIASPSRCGTEALSESIRFLGCNVRVSHSEEAIRASLESGRLEGVPIDLWVWAPDPRKDGLGQQIPAAHFFRDPSMPQLWLNPVPNLFPIADFQPTHRMVHHFGAYTTTRLRQEIAAILCVHPMEKQGLDKPVASEPGPRGSILLVEDDPVHCTIAVDMLQKHSFEVVIASNGAEGLRLFGSRPFEAVLLDCCLEDLDGFQIARFMRQLEAGRKRMPILGMTAKIGPDSINQASAAGMDEVLTKPFEWEEMLTRLRKWVALPVPQARLDLSRLTRILSGLKGKHLAERLLRVYQNAAELEMSHIHAALPQRKIPDILRAAHKLAGSSSTLGANLLTALARQMETTIESGDWDHANRIWVDMQSELSMATSALRKGIEAWYP